MSAANKAKCGKYFDAGLWDESQIAKACEKGKITEAEYKEITGSDYTGEPYIPAEKYAEVQQQIDDQIETDVDLDYRLSTIELGLNA